MNRNEHYFGWHVVAFLDLLGQKDKLRRLTVLPNKLNEEDVREFKEKVQGFYAPLYALKSFFESSIKPYKDVVDDSNLSPDQRTILLQFKKSPIFHQSFSDSLIVHIPLRSDIGQYASRAIYGLLVAICSTFLSHMSKKWPIRGGVDLGIGMYVNGNEIYGPALERSYTLESKIAQYPRVVIGAELIKYLKFLGLNRGSSPEDKVEALMAQKSYNLLVQDDDGYAFLDWLGDDMLSVFQPPLVQDAYNFIIQESIKHKNNQDSKLGFRYTLLRDYVESRLPRWGIAIQREG